MTAIQKGIWELNLEDLAKVKKRFLRATKIITHFYGPDHRPIEEEVGDEVGEAIYTLAEILQGLEKRVSDLEREKERIRE